MKLIFIALLFVLKLISAQDSIGCDYRVENSVYTCILLINNPDGRDDWTAIDGEHLEGFSDADVANLRAFYQVTANIPEILCSTFRNLTVFGILGSQIRSFTSTTFANCQQLESLSISYNLIEELPDNAFINGNLRSIDFSDNRITQLSANTFAGSSGLETIRLDYNEIVAIETAWFEPVRGTLRILGLFSNLLTDLPSRAFEGFQQLEDLQLGANYFADLPTDVFNGLDNLVTLSLYGNRLITLRPEWFSQLPALENLHLEFNSITALPSGIFTNNNRLSAIGMTFNELSRISADSFGNLSNLTTFYGEFNFINAIDADFFDQAVNLRSLFLVNNVCTILNFYDIVATRPSVRQSLQPCFDNFNVDSTIECSYIAAEHFPYTCELFIVNPQGRDDFDSIAGDHIDPNTDTDVLRVEAFSQLTLNIPSIICDRFTNLQEITLTESLVEILTVRSFESCTELTFLDLEHNNITTLPAGLFGSNRLLEILNLNDNHIAAVSSTTFTNTQLFYIDLQHNELGYFLPTWFNPINGTLRALNLIGNFMTYLPPRAFSTLGNLEELEISNNEFSEIPTDAFIGLNHLGYLAMYRCSIDQLHPEWFADLTSLHSLHIETNSIRELPEGVFGNSPGLNDINLSQNQLTTINSNSFANVSSLLTFNAQFNQINAIDPDFFDMADVLYILFLYGNQCASTNFINVVGTRELVRNQLTRCFDNFIEQERGTIECEFVDAGADYGYNCEMTIVNPRGSDDFERIEGTHVEDFNDTNVIRVIAYQQTSTVVPTIICTQFVNLRQMFFGANGVLEITSTAFENCANLEYLNLESNNLQHVPSNLFTNSPNLGILGFSYNQLTSVAENAFANTAILNLRLDGNRFTAIDETWFSDINSTLRFLLLSENLITELPENGFSSLSNLIELDLGLNNLAVVPTSAFSGLGNLEYLWLYRAGIREVHREWFAEMSSLQGVHMNYNQLTTLPSGLFSNNPQLFELNVNGNQLRVIDSDIFGDLQSLLYLSASGNRIQAIDSRIFDDATEIYNLFLFNNICVDEIFLNVVNNRSEVRNQLQNCFDTFDGEGLLQCTYIEDDFLPYRCEFDVQNIAGRDDFESIAGEHVGSRNDGDLLRLESFGQLTFNFPSVICRQFENLEEIYMAFGGIEVLTTSSFEHCQSLNYLNLELNHITTINNEILTPCVNLAMLSFYGNQLSVIEGQAFQGLPLNYLNLDINSLSYVNPGWFEDSPLTYLTMASNSLVSLPSGGFSNLQSLANLILSNNDFSVIPIDAFDGLVSLDWLNLNNCSISSINPVWFEGLNSLRRLYLQNNQINSLPQGVFNNLTHIFISGNNLQSISRNSFNGLESLTQLNAQNNQINGIEPSFFDDATSLYTLQLLNNLCASSNFINIPANRENVRAQLSTCFENFESTEISCNYMYDFPYTCYLTLFNPLGRNDFESIAGTHLSGRGDNDVTYLDALGQQSSVFPEVICRQFANLNYVYIVNSEIEVLTPETFAQCTWLMSLTLDGNRITELSDNLFINSRMLALISVAMNRLTRVSENAFAGTNLMLVDLEQNELTELPESLFATNTNILYLILSGNQFVSLPSNLLNGLNFLSFFDISNNNQLSDLPENFFNGLGDVRTLAMNNCNISTLNPQWFNDLTGLFDLYMSANPIDELPIGVFHSLTRVEYLAMDNLNLEILDSLSFGEALRSLRVLRARGNRINAVDPLIIENSIDMLQELYLLNNICVDNNFSNVQMNIEEVRGDLGRCFGNFD